MLVVVGCPIVIKQKLYNCAVVISDGSILGIVPKTHLPNYSEFYELRHFTSGEGLEERSLVWRRIWLCKCSRESVIQMQRDSRTCGSM